MGTGNELGGVGTGDDLRDTVLHPLRRLPVAARCKRIAVLVVRLMRFGIPCALVRACDQLGSDAVALDGEGVIGVALIDIIDEFEIGIGVFWQARQRWEDRDDILAVQTPERLKPVNDWGNAGWQRPEFLLFRDRFKSRLKGRGLC